MCCDQSITVNEIQEFRQGGKGYESLGLDDLYASLVRQPKAITSKIKSVVTLN